MINARFCFLISYFLFLQNSFAQDVLWGPTGEASSTVIVPIVFHEDESHVFTYDFHSDSLFISGLNKSNLEVNTMATLDFSSLFNDNDELIMLDVKAAQNNYLLLYMGKASDSKEVRVYVLRLRRTDAEVIGEPTIVQTLSSELDLENVLFLSDRSRNFSAIRSFTITETDDVVESLTFFDSNYNLTSDTSIVIPIDRVLDEGNALIDKDGNLFVIENQEQFIELKMYQGSDEINEKVIQIPHGIPVEDGFITDLSPNVLEDELIILGSYGTYDKKTKKDGSDKVIDNQKEGKLFIRINRTNAELIDVTLSKLPEDYVRSFATKRQLEKNKTKMKEPETGVTNSRLFRLIDGSYIYVAEYFTYMNRDELFIGVTAETFVLGDLVIFKFNADGTIEWAKKIPKYQIYGWSLDDMVYGTTNGPRFFDKGLHFLQFYGYSCFLNDDKLYLIYNDNPKNIDTQEINGVAKSWMMKIKKARPAIVTLDVNSGSLSRSRFEGLNSNDMWFNTSSAYQSNFDGAIYFQTQRKKNFRYGKFTLNK